METDDFKKAWREQSSRTRITIDADVLLKEIRRNQQTFTATIYWRDVREVGVALLLIPIWIWIGVSHSPPWTWYLEIPALVWIAAFMLVDRWRHEQRLPQPGEPIRRHVEHSLADVEHQIWLLRNVLWWYLLPSGLPIFLFFCQTAARRAEARDWWLSGDFVGAVAILVILYALIYWLNQFAVRSMLEPRRQELETLRLGLAEEAHPQDSQPRE